mgnify:FL=1
MIQISHAKEYNETPDNNRLVRKVKALDFNAIEQMAEEMAHLIPHGAKLIPAPGRSGAAKSMLYLCYSLMERTYRTEVCDIIKGKHRESVYDAKKEGRILSGEDYGFYLNEPIPSGDVVLIDNVMATGNTMKHLLKLVPHARICVHSIDSRHFNIKNLH